MAVTGRPTPPDGAPEADGEQVVDEPTGGPAAPARQPTGDQLVDTVRRVAEGWAERLATTPGRQVVAGDLRAHTELLAHAPLVAALAGHGPSVAAMAAGPTAGAAAGPDAIDPDGELLVADADAAQSAVLAAVVAGADVVVHGPPGTGKTQTVANLVATLAATGRSTVFVAGSPAAATALVGRLERAGLGSLVADLHTGTDALPLVGAQLSAPPAPVRRPEPPSQATAALVERRAELVAHEASVHGLRAPWGVSVYQARTRLGEVAPADRSPIRLDDATLGRLDQAGFAAARDALRAFVGLGGLRVATGRSPWSAAYRLSSVTTVQAAQAARALTVSVATRTWPEASALLTTVAGRCGLPPHRDLAGWRALLELLASAQDLRRDFGPGLLDLPLGSIVEELELGGRRPLGLGAGGRARSAMERLRQAATPGRRPDRRRLRQVATEGARVQARWAALTGAPGTPVPPPELERAVTATRQLRADLLALGALLGLDDLDRRPAPELSQLLGALSGDTETLMRLPDLAERRAALTEAGLADVLAEIVGRAPEPDGALATLDWVWLSSVAARVVTDPLISHFDGAATDRAVDEFRRADRAHVAGTPARVRHLVADRLAETRAAQPIQAQLVNRQAPRLADWDGLRELLRAAGDLLTAACPCWLLTPSDAAAALPAQRCFDTVIIDEASRVGVAEAVGTLARGDHAVVVGDPLQLGPDDGDQSVLDALGALLPAGAVFALPTHYRSRDERLVSFVNAQPELYGGALETFPGTGPGSPLRAVVADPGRDVETAVDEVRHHARTSRARSLGVVTIGAAHARRVRDALKAACDDDRALADFVAGRASPASAIEPVWVRDAAAVQGGERDSVILAVTVGRRGDFGPLDGSAGPPLLNVATTRARATVTVVTPIAPADLDPALLTSVGARLWAGYLAHAAGTAPPQTARSGSGPIERDIAAHLGRAGIPLVAGYGASAHPIDLAASHPTKAGRMVLAIETDGESYHGSPTARDRERIRPEQLERLGWRVHRIWSSEWLRHRDHEVARVLRSYRLAVAAADAANEAPAPAPVHDAPVSPGPGPVEGAPVVEPTSPVGGPAAPTGGAPIDASPARRGPVPIRTGRDSIGEYRQEELVALVRWIRSDGVVRDDDTLRREVVAALGFRKAGRLIVAAVDAAIVHVAAS